MIAKNVRDDEKTAIDRSASSVSWSIYHMMAVTQTKHRILDTSPFFKNSPS
jgi:hypothetical protein